MYSFTRLSLTFKTLEAANLFRVVALGLLPYKTLTMDINHFESNDSNLIYKDLLFQLNQLVVFPTPDFNGKLTFEAQNITNEFMEYGTGNLLLDGAPFDLKMLGLIKFPLGKVNRKIESITKCGVSIDKIDIVDSNRFNPNKQVDWDGEGNIALDIVTGYAGREGEITKESFLADVFDLISKQFLSYKGYNVWDRDEGYYGALWRKMAFDGGFNIQVRREFYREERSTSIKCEQEIIDQFIDVCIEKIKADMFKAERI